MRYMLLIHHDEKVHEMRTDAERQAGMKETLALARDLDDAGQYVDAAPLHPTSTATSVRVRDGRRLVTDGPFAETKEQLGGYFVIEATDLDEAIGIAARIPPARWGTVEIRPVREVEGLPAPRRTGEAT